MSSIIDSNLVCQIGMVVHDLKKTGQAWADFLGVQCPEVVDSGDDAIVKAEYEGNPSTASCKMMFFNTPNIQIELIQPDEKPSVWRKILDEKGEGLHHIAFQVKDSLGKIKTLQEKGYPLMQKGNYGNGAGMYSYIDTRADLKLIIELLENF